MSSTSAPSSARALDLIHQKLSNLWQAKAELQATNKAQASRINSTQQDMTQLRQHHEETQQCSSMKIEKLDKEMNIVNEMLLKAEEAITKAQRRNSVYDFTLLKIKDIHPGSLLGTVHRIKSQRLEYRHSSPQTAQRIILSTSLLQIAQENSTLAPLELSVLDKLMKWVLQELPNMATLADLKNRKSGATRQTRKERRCRGSKSAESQALTSVIKRPWIDNHAQAALQRRITDNTSALAENSELAQDSALAVLKPKGTEVEKHQLSTCIS
ncbi:hypothetical protein MJO28_013431 [Puccinia striiformis f. sp. tritici]|uniref:Uncharacterized protein n=2 Tax=Puccinia striiformis f. sp. tritici TaxID=168172 RepID=A0A0L0VXS9_9BASI|nr:hypothetical protein MJO28_013431 [Puccinia striiformis f. sp. tritici]KNF04073.1 hypothetical protein PSTG_02778 [Puccinia striiformis f. sp. tritici PST-78]